MGASPRASGSCTWASACEGEAVCLGLSRGVVEVLRAGGQLSFPPTEWVAAVCVAPPPVGLSVRPSWSLSMPHSWPGLEAPGGLVGQPCCVPERAGPRGPRVRGTFLAPGRAWLPCPAVMAVVGKVSSWTARHQEPQLHSSLGCRLAGTSESQPQAYPPPRGLCLSPAGTALPH